MIDVSYRAAYSTFLISNLGNKLTFGSYMYCNDSDGSGMSIDGIDNCKKAIINMDYFNTVGNSLLVKGIKSNGDEVILYTISSKVTNLELDISDYVRLGIGFKQLGYCNTYVYIVAE